jgi:hypothetical protein
MGRLDATEIDGSATRLSGVVGEERPDGWGPHVSDEGKKRHNRENAQARRKSAFPRKRKTSLVLTRPSEGWRLAKQGRPARGRLGWTQERF